jgi:signal transduction histidine kinase
MRKPIFIGIILLILLSLLALGCSGGKSEQPSGYQYEATQKLVNLVTEAASLVEENGNQSFAEFRTEGSKWWQGEDYVFVLDTEGNMLVHPDPALEGKNQLGLKDVTGKPIIQHFIYEVTGYEGKTEGWTHYLWPIPGEIMPTWKTTFVKLATDPSGQKYIVGSGVYNMKMERAFVEDEVKDAAQLIESKGTDAFNVFRDQTSEFLFPNGYIFVFTQEGTDVVNPAFRYLEGQNVMDLKDSEGKYLVREMFDLLEKQDSGWVDYMWPKPGESKSTQKSSFVTRAELGDTWFLVGSGVYLQ